MGWLRKRFGESSTYAGLGVLTMLASTAFPQYAAIIQAVAGVLGAGAVVVPEKGQ